MPDDIEPPSTKAQRWPGADRRRWSREPPPPAGIIRHARVRPEWSRHVHRLTAGVWYPVRERNTEALRPEPLEGYIWVEVHGRLEHTWLEHVEVRRIVETPAT
jgi:hypothetical protein